MKRRTLLGLGGLSLGALLTGTVNGPVWAEEAGDVVWEYEPLDPKMVGALAYRHYADGRCMYAVFRAIVESVGKIRSEAHPEEAVRWSSFPYYMMRYGKTGVFDYGSLCGTLNGCAAVIGLFVTDKEDASRMATELFQYYETTSLPNFVPEDSEFSDIPKSIPESVLCHISIGTWTIEAGEEVDSPRRSDRCKRLAADIAMKTVMMLNQYFESKRLGKECSFAPITEPAAGCVKCHSPKGSRKDANTKMNCLHCHDDLDIGHGQ